MKENIRPNLSPIDSSDNDKKKVKNVCTERKMKRKVVAMDTESSNDDSDHECK